MVENGITSVQVALRIRPLIANEIINGYQRALETVPNEPQVFVKGTDKAFTFNYVFDLDVSQEQLYNEAVKSMIESLFNGYNVTILAYGQTGSGKTYTMGTTYIDNDMQMGVVQRAVTDVFNRIDSQSEEYDFHITISFIELYQELLYDLLANRPRDQCTVDIREDTHGELRVFGLTESVVTNAEEVAYYLKQGSQLRATGATAMNAQSSRSHAIITVTIQQNKKDSPLIITSKFHLVDLAGSERPKKTKATGERFKEGVKINQGLLALGNVISALGDENQKLHTHIPYRDSKLTRLLQHSLGGNSITLMIACVSPSNYNLDETLSTLRYADRARKIKNKPIINQDPQVAEITRLSKQLKELQSQLDDQQLTNGKSTLLTELHELREENMLLQQKNRQLTEQLQHMITESSFMFERSIILENGKEKLKKKIVELKEECEKKCDVIKTNDDKEKEESNFVEYLKCKIEELVQYSNEMESEIIQYDATSNPRVSVSDTSADIYSGNNTIESPKSIENAEMNYENGQESHMRQQLAFSNQLQELTRTLAIKEQLASQMAANNCSIYSVDETLIQDNQNKIAALMKEKEELLQQLKNMQSSSSCKISEQRRCRVQELENQIQELNKKVREQARLLKLKERNDLKIKELNNEIVSMKQTKIKLVRLMRQESDKFRQWKLEREKEVIKLKDKDRKRQNEMLRMESMFVKQQSVLKRKFEEASAINKRLKDVLALQKSVQEKRLQTNGNRLERIQNWLSQELEISISTAEAERTLERLIEEKRAVIKQKELLLIQKTVNECELNEIDEEIDWRSSQISDIKQKIFDCDQEIKLKTKWDLVQTMSEAKFALKYLFELCSEMRRRDFISIAAYRDEIDIYKEKLNLLEGKHNELLIRYEKKIAGLEKQYEEKVFNLIQQIYAQKAGAGDQGVDIITTKVEEITKNVDDVILKVQSLTNSTNIDLISTEVGDAQHRQFIETEDDFKFNQYQDLSENFEETSSEIKIQENNLELGQSETILDDSLLPDLCTTKSRVTLRAKKKHSAKCKCKSSCLTRHCSCKKHHQRCSYSCTCTNCENNEFSNSQFSEICKDNFKGKARYFEVMGAVKTAPLKKTKYGALY